MREFLKLRPVIVGYMCLLIDLTQKKVNFLSLQDARQFYNLDPDICQSCAPAYPQRPGSRALSSPVIALQEGGAQILERDSPEL